MEYESVLSNGYRIDEYEIVRVLGVGGFGVTYLGHDHHLDKPVAIKEYLPNDLAVRKGDTSVVARSSGDQGDFEWGLERFLEEARVLARFDHPNLPKVHRFFKAHGTAYIVMEYVEGTILADVFSEQGRLTEASLKAIIFPLLDGLSMVHEAGYLHRDIKPANIVIRDDGGPVLLDFGAARAALGVKSRSLTSIVTPGYAPIEQYSSRGNQGAWTDLYGVAAVMYRGLAGAAPHDVTDRVRNDPLTPAAEFARGQASQPFLQAIDWALSVDEKDRPRTIEAWRQALDQELPRTEVLRPPDAGPSRPRIPPWQWAAAAAAVALIGSGVWITQAPPGGTGVAGGESNSGTVAASATQEAAPPEEAPDKPPAESQVAARTEPDAGATEAANTEPDSGATDVTQTESDAGTTKATQIKPDHGAAETTQTESGEAADARQPEPPPVPELQAKVDTEPAPESPAADSAVKTEEEVYEEWAQAVETDSPEAYRRFISEYPDSRYAKLAQVKLEVIERDLWSEANEQNTQTAYENFLNLFPDSRFAKIAELRAGRLQ